MRAFQLITFVGWICACMAWPWIASAAPCAAGDDARVTFSIQAAGRNALTTDVTIQYWITPYTDADGGAPDHGELTVPFGERTVHEVPAGEGEMVLEASGFEPLLFDRDFCGDISIHDTMLPEGTSTFSLHSVRRSGDHPAKGAKVTLDGLAQRIGAQYTAYADDDGTVTITDVLPGDYAVSVWLPLGDSHEFMDVSNIDLWGDAHLSVRLVASADKPDVTTSCSAVAPGGRLWMQWMAFLAIGSLLWQRMRMRRCHG